MANLCFLLIHAPFNSDLREVNRLARTAMKNPTPHPCISQNGRKRRIATRTDVPLRHHRLAKSCRQFRSLHPFLRSNNAGSHLLHEYAQVCKRNTAGIGKKGLSPLTTRLPFVRKPTETHNTRYHQLPSAHF